jgi:hypothetical protein
MKWTIPELYPNVKFLTSPNIFRITNLSLCYRACVKLIHWDHKDQCNKRKDLRKILPFFGRSNKIIMSRPRGENKRLDVKGHKIVVKKIIHDKYSKCIHVSLNQNQTKTRFEAQLICTW